MIFPLPEGEEKSLILRKHRVLEEKRKGRKGTKEDKKEAHFQQRPDVRVIFDIYIYIYI